MNGAVVACTERASRNGPTTLCIKKSNYYVYHTVGRTTPFTYLFCDLLMIPFCPFTGRSCLHDWIIMNSFGSEPVPSWISHHSSRSKFWEQVKLFLACIVDQPLDALWSVGFTQVHYFMNTIQYQELLTSSFKSSHYTYKYWDGKVLVQYKRCMLSCTRIGYCDTILSSSAVTKKE